MMRVIGATSHHDSVRRRWFTETPCYTFILEPGGLASVWLHPPQNERHEPYVVYETRDGIEALLNTDPQYANFICDVDAKAYLDGAAANILKRFQQNEVSIRRILARFRAPSADEYTTVQSFVDCFLHRIEPPMLAYQMEKGVPPQIVHSRHLQLVPATGLRHLRRHDTPAPAASRMISNPEQSRVNNAAEAELMSIDALIFDGDGVLIDSKLLVCRIAAQELTAIGYQISTEDVVRRFAGRPDRKCVPRLNASGDTPFPPPTTSA